MFARNNIVEIRLAVSYLSIAVTYLLDGPQGFPALSTSLTETIEYLLLEHYIKQFVL